MATDGPFKVVPFENSGGTISFRITGTWKGERMRKNFANRADAEARCNQKNAEVLNAATPSVRLAHTRLSEIDVASAEASVERAAGRWPLARILTAGVAALEAEALKPPPAPIAPLFAEFLALMEKELNVRWLREIKNRGEAFVTAHPNLTDAAFDRAVVRKYLDGRNVSPQTKANDRNVIHRFGGWLVERGILKDNPGAGIWISRKGGKKNADGTRAMPAVFTPLQAEAFLRACETAECRRLKGWATLTTLCGLRPENEAPRLLWPEIKLDAATLRVRGTKRGQKPRVMPLQPNAIAWLQQVKEDGEKTPGYYARHLRLRAVKVANEWLAKHHPKEPRMKWVQDIARHSYASYRSGDGIDVKTLSEETGNSPDVIYGFYRNPQEPADVKCFWGIFPK